MQILPILTLINFILAHHDENMAKVFENAYSRFIFLGLCFSMLGDVILVYQNHSDACFAAGKRSCIVVTLQFSFAVSLQGWFFCFSYGPCKTFHWDWEKDASLVMFIHFLFSLGKQVKFILTEVKCDIGWNVYSCRSLESFLDYSHRQKSSLILVKRAT